MLKTHVLLSLLVYFLAIYDHPLDHDHIHSDQIALKKTEDRSGLIV